MTFQKPPAPLWKAQEVATRLGVDRRRVYELPLARIEVSSKCFRWDPEDVEEFINNRRKN